MQVVSSYPNNMFCWIDLEHHQSQTRAKEFYRRSVRLGVSIDIPTPMGVPYTLCQIDGYNVAGLSHLMPDVKCRPRTIPPIWTSYIKHDDADAVAAKVTAAGGKVFMSPVDIMESGRMAMIQDPTGAVVGIWQPKDHVGAQLVNRPNALVWNELQTKDTDAALSFYETVFGWGHDQDPNGYHLFKLGERMQAGMLKMDDSWGDIPPNWGTYFMSEDIEATAAKAQELGGVIHVPPTHTGTVGRFAVIQDPQGGVFTAMQFDGPVDPPPGY